MRGYSTGDAAVDSFIVDSSKRYRIDPLLIYTQMAQESSFKTRASSYKGASGLMQLIPTTARRLGVTNIYDPQQNIEGGVKYIRILLDMFDQDLDQLSLDTTRAKVPLSNTATRSRLTPKRRITYDAFHHAIVPWLQKPRDLFTLDPPGGNRL